MKLNGFPKKWIVFEPSHRIRTLMGGDTGIEILERLVDKDGNVGGYATIVGHVNCQHNMRILTRDHAQEICDAVNGRDEMAKKIASLRNTLEDIALQPMSNEWARERARAALADENISPPPA